MAIELCEPAAGRAARPLRGAKKFPPALVVADARVFVISNGALSGETNRTAVPATAGQFFNIECSATAELMCASTVRGLGAIKDRAMQVDKVEALA
jgi:hypothetical protein